MTKLHRSTVYRRKTKAPSPRGRRRCDPEEEAEILGLAAGVIDTINKEGTCPLWKLTKVGRDASTPATLLKGSEKTMTKLASLGFPARSVLYAVARLHLGVYKEAQIANADGIATRKTKFKQSISETLFAADAERAERFPGSLPRSRAVTPVCSVYEYKAAGLDRKMCAYLKKQKHVIKAFLAVRLLFTAPLPLSEGETLDRALLKLPKLSARLNDRVDL